MLFPWNLVEAIVSTMFLPSFISRFIIATSFFTPRTSEAERSTQPLLRLNTLNEFHIAIFSDLHYGEEEDGWGIDQDVNSTRVINNILDAEAPDFVILNGDLITGENTFLTNSTKYIDVIVQPLVERNLPWASTYGNHDSQFNLSREALFSEEEKFELSYTQHSPQGVPGVTNYYIPIYPQGDDGDPVAILWFFDSQGGAPFQAPADSETIPNWVTPEIASWFLSEQVVIKEKWGELPSLAFVHIPPTAFLKFQETVLPNYDQESAHYPGLNDDVPLAAEGDGWQDVPFMQALVDTPKLHSVYSGHDHGDAWCGNWPDVTNVTTGANPPFVCFCKHSGYGGYGNWNRGSRNLRLSFADEMDVESWVRMENGEVVQRVDLNSTYGSDVYSLADGEDPSYL